MKPSERIAEIEQVMREKYKFDRFRPCIEALAVMQYLDEQWEKDRPLTSHNAEPILNDEEKLIGYRRGPERV